MFQRFLKISPNRNNKVVPVQTSKFITFDLNLIMTIFEVTADPTGLCSPGT